MIGTKTKTEVVTNTQIMVATLAAFLAGGLAFAGAPGGKNLLTGGGEKCIVASMSFGTACGKEKYNGGSFTCSNGVKISVGNKCQSVTDIQKFAATECAKLSCAENKTKFTILATTAPKNSGKATTSAPVVVPPEAPTSSPIVPIATSTPEPALAAPRLTPGPDMVRLAANAPIELNTCGTPVGGWQPYNTYVVTQDIQIAAGLETCFSFGRGVHDIVLDCQSHIIDGLGVANAKGVTLQGRTDLNILTQYNEIKNCRIKNVRTGIDIIDVDYTIIRGNTVDTSSHLAISVYGDNNLVESNTSINSKVAHIVVHNSTYTKVIGNTIFTNTVWSGGREDMDDGIRLSGDLSHDNTIEDNTIDSVHGNGMEISGGITGTQIKNNNIQRANLRGLSFSVPEQNSNLRVSNNLVCGNGHGNYTIDVSCYSPVTFTGSGNRFTHISDCGPTWPIVGEHYNQCQ